MFGKEETSMSFAAGTTTLISSNTEMVGDIHFSENLVVEGVIKGDIYAPVLVINGRVNGNVYASQHIELAEKAVVSDNVHYASIEMVKGAQVNGQLVHQVDHAGLASASLPLVDADVEPSLAS